MEIEEIKTAAENAMKAFEALKTDVLPLKKKFEDLDGESKGQFAKMEKTISDAIEASQKADSKVKAAEETLKSQEAQIKALETAINRAPAGSTEEKTKELKAKQKKAFNDFAKSHKSGTQTFAESSVFEQAIANDPELKAMVAASDPAGGYLTMPDFGGIITERIFESSPIRQLATVTSVNSDSYEVILDNDEASCEWVGEVQTRSDTNTPTLGKLVIPVNELSALPKVSQKMLDDGIVDVESWLGGKVGDIFGRTEATSFVTGNGVNKPKGMMSYTSGTTIASQQVQQVNAGSTTDFTYNGLVDLTNALKEPYHANAVFLMQRASFASVMKLKDGEGRPIFNPNYDKVAGLTTQVMGRPLYFAADIASISSASLSAIYGDIRRAYQIVDRIGFRVLRDPFTSKPHVLFYTTKRVGGAVVNFEAYKIQKMS